MKLLFIQLLKVKFVLSETIRTNMEQIQINIGIKEIVLSLNIQMENILRMSI